MMSFVEFLSGVTVPKKGVIREGEGETYCAFQSSKAGFVYFFKLTL